MDSNRIKNLATGAREALRAEVSARLDAVLVEGSRERLESASQVSAIEADVREHGRDEVVDRAAYTWFNRLCALRFMDVNGCTPVPVVTPRAGQTQPAILADARRGIFDPEYEISSEARRQIVALLTGSMPSMNAAEDAYSLLLRAACERYAGPMGYLFAEHIASSLLMPQGLLAQGSILSRIVGEMDEQACSSVEVLGWLYQFYIAERKNVYFKSKKKATSADIPAATQLFTPEWIVRYLAENSLGRLWMLNNPGSSLSDSMEYYIAPEGNELHIEIASADEIRVLDPACGSGHILVYAFDLLFSMYEEEGWLPEDIPSMILQNNLFGLEIDRRAAEITSFALEMKARERDQKFFEHNVAVNVHVLDPVVLEPQELHLVPNLAKRKALLDVMAHLDEAGSLYMPDPLDEFVLQDELEHVEHNGSIFTESTISKLSAMLANVRALSQSFHCVVANPPYMGAGNMNPWLSKWVKKYYPDEKADLCTCFIERSFTFAVQLGYASLITMHSWMFLGSYEKMRKKLIASKFIVSMAHLGTRAFEAIGGEVVQATSTIFLNQHDEGKGSYVRLVDYDSSEKKRASLTETIRNPNCDRFYRVDAEKFKVIPGCPIAYWIGDSFFATFGSDSLRCVAYSEGQNKPGNTAKYVRKHWEVSRSGLGQGRRWIPYAKGGGYRKWYGLVDDAIDWSEESRAFYRADYVARIVPKSVWYRSGVTWGKIASVGNSFRYFPKGGTFDSGGITIFFKDDDESTMLNVLALLNTPFAAEVLKVINPTLNCQLSDVLSIPYVGNFDNVATLAFNNIAIARADWDSFETSWDFVRHPMVYIPEGKSELLSNCFSCWEVKCRDRFDTLKANEEELNRIFARLYHMEGEVPIEVSDDKVSVRLADRVRDARSLISYGIGCLFGRYSAEVDGLVLADQGATLDDFREKVLGVAFMPDADNVLPILADEWFDDDVVTGFRAWLAHTFGEATVDENVAWLEESLGRDLRSYLCKGFYADHLKVYQKRPIYWMFQSPKKSFQCLVYMHRYDEGTVGTILTGYLRPLEDKLRARLVILDAPGASAADAREANKVRGTIAELKQWEREVIYPLAHERVSIDLDNGVKVNYNKFPRALAKVAGLSDWK